VEIDRTRTKNVDHRSGTDPQNSEERLPVSPCPLAMKHISSISIIGKRRNRTEKDASKYDGRQPDFAQEIQDITKKEEAEEWANNRAKRPNTKK
jgi:hypothetical protein